MLTAGPHDLGYTVEDLFAEGDKVADRLTWQATHQGEPIRLRTTPEAPRRHFCSERSLQVAIEAGTHSPWVSRLLKECGH